MSRKVLPIALTLALMLSIPLVMVPVVTGAGIPNPSHFFTASIGMPETVDPHWAYDTASGTIIQNIYEPLVAFNKTSTEEFIPVLADWWPGLGTNPGNTIDPIRPGWNGSSETWLFRIRPNVPWQDSDYGTVTAADVEYSVERGMLMDHSMGPMWMLYEPLTGKYLSYQWDLDEDDTLSETEYAALAAVIDNAIQQNGTHVWFNLYMAYAPFQQILSQTWGMIINKQWSIDHDLWKGDFTNYTDFLRTWDPPEPGPLMDSPDAPGPVIPGAVAMGTGPFTLKAMNPDPHTGWYTLEKFDGYWNGWPAEGSTGSLTLVTYKNVEEWPNRKAQFFSTDPGLQVDIAAVPRPNIPELHKDGNISGPTHPGFDLYKFARPILYSTYFVFTVDPHSTYVPLLGATPRPDLFQDRYLRLAFMHTFNFTKFIADVYLGEAVQSPIPMPAGTAFFNASKPKYAIDLTKAEEYFKLAWGGDVWDQGITVKITYNTGNVIRQTTAEMFEYYVENFIPWTAPIEIEVEGVPWATYLPGMKNRQYGMFIVGWLADFPDPHNWLSPFMHTKGTYPSRANVTYGLDPTSLAANWYEGATYGPPPYTNALGEYVTEINNTYVDHLIDTAVGESAAIRHLLYEELFDIYYADATQLPMCYTITRRYVRTWVQGMTGSYSMNPISPGLYYYPLWKAAIGAVESVDISAIDTITNTTTAYPLIQVYLDEMRLSGAPTEINYTISVYYKTGTIDTLVYIGLLRNDTTVANWTVGDMFFPLDFQITLGPGESYTREITWYENGTMWTGTWTISLTASPTSGMAGQMVDDPNLVNNKDDSPQTVEAKELAGDIDGTGEVDIFDAIILGVAFGAERGDPLWNSLADLIPDGIVDIFDAIVLAGNFGSTIP